MHFMIISIHFIYVIYIYVFIQSDFLYPKQFINICNIYFNLLLHYKQFWCNVATVKSEF